METKLRVIVLMGLGASRETKSPKNIGKDPGGSRVGPGPPSTSPWPSTGSPTALCLCSLQSSRTAQAQSQLPACPSPCFHVVKNIRAYGKGAPTVVQATGAPEPVVHHLRAHVGTLAHEQAVLDLLLGAIIIREGSTAARRSGLRGSAGSGMWGDTRECVPAGSAALTWPVSGQCHCQQTWGCQSRVSN